MDEERTNTPSDAGKGDNSQPGDAQGSGKNEKRRFSRRPSGSGRGRKPSAQPGQAESAPRSERPAQAQEPQQPNQPAPSSQRDGDNRRRRGRGRNDHRGGRKPPRGSNTAGDVSRQDTPPSAGGEPQENRQRSRRDRQVTDPPFDITQPPQIRAEAPDLTPNGQIARPVPPENRRSQDQRRRDGNRSRQNDRRPAGEQRQQGGRDQNQRGQQNNRPNQGSRPNQNRQPGQGSKPGQNRQPPGRQPGGISAPKLDRSLQRLRSQRRVWDPGRDTDRGIDRSEEGGEGNNGIEERTPAERSRYVNLDFSRPAPSIPIRTNEGIKARSQRGAFSKNWWARRWIEAMEQLVDPLRLQRGRSYARTGQVLSIQESRYGVEARVQGSRPQPYDVTIQVTPLTDEQWERVIDALSEQALFTAQLLAGEMPGNIEDAFQTAGVSLFPTHAGDLFTNCSCPDWANPCKHVAATHYILGDRFDDDPFLLFRMRGRSQEQILQALRQRRAGMAETYDEAPVEETTGEPLENAIDNYWNPAQDLELFELSIRPPSMDMPLFQRLGEPAFFNGESLQTLLKPVYDTFTRSALRAAYTEEEEEENGES